jgi:hypothetical protein
MHNLSSPFLYYSHFSAGQIPDIRSFLPFLMLSCFLPSHLLCSQVLHLLKISFMSHSTYSCFNFLISFSEWDWPELGVNTCMLIVPLTYTGAFLKQNLHMFQAPVAWFGIYLFTSDTYCQCMDMSSHSVTKCLVTGCYSPGSGTAGLAVWIQAMWPPPDRGVWWATHCMWSKGASSWAAVSPMWLASWDEIGSLVLSPAAAAALSLNTLGSLSHRSAARKQGQSSKWL